jgi:hypothetical protein
MKNPILLPGTGFFNPKLICNCFIILGFTSLLLTLIVLMWRIMPANSGLADGMFL